jgi:hypothetical protein
MADRRLLLALVPVALGVLAVLVGFGGRTRDNPVLTGDVGLNDQFTISLTDSQGVKVTHLDSGMYTLVVHDRSSLHNFHLVGPGTDVTTDVAGTGDRTFTVTLADGTYVFQCDPHAAGGMKGSFTVGNPATTTIPAKPAKVTARIGPGSRIAVSGASSLAPGKVVITVRDTSRLDNFHLRGPGVDKATGVLFRGTTTWSITVRPGTYVFRSDRHAKLRGSFTVTAPDSGDSGAGPGY